MIFVSTCSNYGIGSKKLLKEDDDLKPLSYYSKQKVKIEQLLIKIKKVNFIWTILRFATAFGVSPRMRFDLTINHFVKSLLDKEQLEIYDSQTFRPYCHVKDFARAIKKIMSSNPKKINNAIFNVGSNRNNFSKRKIYEKISMHIKNTKVRFLKKGFDKRDYVVNFKKINKVLNFKTIYSVDYGIREIIKYVKQNYKENKSLKNFGNYKIRKLKKII